MNNKKTSNENKFFSVVLIPSTQLYGKLVSPCVNADSCMFQQLYKNVKHFIEIIFYAVSQ